MRLQTVVAAIDARDDLAESVIQTADSLARRDGGQLHIVEAWPILSATPVAYTPEMAAGSALQTQAISEGNERARKLQEEALTQLARARNPAAQAAVIAGEPADVISQYAKEVDADVIVTGSHQRGFWGALLTGGGARAVVREAPCAVFLVTKPFAEKVSAAGRF